jgi:manganese/iron transport system substrate-binding protein
VTRSTFRRCALSVACGLPPRLRRGFSSARSAPWPFTVLVLALVLPDLAGGAVSAVDVAQRAVTSNTVLADIVANVAGGRFQVRALAPAGTDPHTFQPTPDSIRMLSQARLVFFNGAGLEEWWDRTIRGVTNPAVPVIELSQGLATLGTSGGNAARRGQAEGRDPHVWLDPILVKVYADRIRDALSRVDRANAALYADRAKAYQGTLDDLDAWIRSEIRQIPAARRKLVTFHNAFQYFAQRYGLAVRGFVVESPGKEPSAKALAGLTRQIKQEQIPAVFAEADFNAKLLQTLARDAGVKVVTTLYDGSLSSGPPADTYINMMRHNVAQMVDALK